MIKLSIGLECVRYMQNMVAKYLNEIKSDFPFHPFHLHQV